MSGGFLERTAMGFARAFTRAMESERIARQRGLLQLLDPRVRVIGMLWLVVSATLTRSISVVAGLFAVAVALAICSRVSLLLLAKRVWLVVLGFTGVIALPAIFLTPGRVVAASGALWITEQGLRTAGLLVLRVETAVTLCALLVLCTPWASLLQALRALRLPREAIAMLAMTYRYVFLLVETASQMFASRRSRRVGVLRGAEQRRMAARTAGVLLSKSIETSNQVYLAMQSRGFRGEVETLSSFHMTMWDCVALLLFVVAGVLAAWMGR